MDPTPKVPPVIRTENIRSLSDFRQHASAHLERLAETGEPLVLTVNGEARGVVLSPEAFDRLAAVVEDAEIALAVRKSLAEFEAGEGIPLREGFARLAAGLGIPFER